MDLYYRNYNIMDSKSQTEESNNKRKGVSDSKMEIVKVVCALLMTMGFLALVIKTFIDF